MAHCILLIGVDSYFYYWRIILENPHVTMVHLLFLGVDHFLSCGQIHIIGTLHIHIWLWLLWDSHMWIGQWSHASCGPLSIFGWLLWSTLLGG